MPLDTRKKRASSVGIMLTSILAPPAPDGMIDQADRQHIAWSYVVLAGEAVTGPFRVQAAQMFIGGAVAGSAYMAGAKIGGVI